MGVHELVCVNVCTCLLCQGCPKSRTVGGSPEGRENSLGLVPHGPDSNLGTYFKIDLVTFVKVTSCYLVAEEASWSCRLARTPQTCNMLELKGSWSSPPQRLHGAHGETQAQDHAAAGAELGRELRPPASLSSVSLVRPTLSL